MVQRLIPGAGYVDETGSAQRLIPGVGYVGESQSAGGTTHTTTGSLAGSGAAVAGTSVHVVVHSSTGALAAGGADIAGSATHSAPAGTHDTSGTLTAGGAAIAGAAGHIVVHSATGSITAGGAALSGSSVHSVPGSGTITITDFRDLTTGELRANETGITVIVNDRTSGALVVKLTGQTTDASADGAFSDAAIVGGTIYRVTTILSDGSEGTWLYTAA